jgi:hypothetical protein
MTSLDELTTVDDVSIDTGSELLEDTTVWDDRPASVMLY